ncbi:RNA 2',3'-cyclic phosphodiesterase [Pseudalkalibacillus berkeleyi]|uniref:RNA 2',3'-cyclic phosphodiesterase n=1 Tax=Pseudalkalibacillus berkeleyi TaxID=1069813 RepID=A0ABS9H014_9BACL|nr:RNA 2',3'-cyclic phosphodiesterase [Pseudalkalibacillus berkeleyi]MCF6138334.1 RNA 2',3'-cyclic phosphodiesterase [Pseudalkalibacillus berkeleyi]
MDRHTFLAIPIPEHIQMKIYTYAQSVKEILPLKKWTSLGDYHITLQFLGATSEQAADKVIDHLNVESMNAFEIELDSTGVFGNPETPRVSWVGLKSSTELQSLHEKVKNSCSQAGFEVDSRPFCPHITLGKRWGGKTPITQSLPEPNHLQGLKWSVNEVILYEIYPKNEQKYVPYHRFKLGKDF